jgi:hypothetical protein
VTRWLALLAAQTLPLTALPPEMEGTLAPYVNCVDAQFTKSLKLEARDGPSIMRKALAACRSIKGRAMEDAERALQKAPGFSDAAKRRAFVLERFQGLDALFESIVSPEGDPDNWNDDAKN